MEVIHNTPFSARLMPILDKDGAEARVAVLKATYEIAKQGALRIADEQVPIREVDEFMGEPATSSVRYEGDGAYFKPSTDLIVIGSVFAPGGRKVRSCMAGLSVGRLSKIVQVFGDRHWNYGLLRVSKSEPEPFDEMPICWERAFGGSDPSAPSEDGGHWEPRNPIGTGFRVARGPEALDGVRLPNFEDPRNLISGWKDKPAPQGFGFIGHSWMPRRRYAGTYDEAWKKIRMPIPPEDFDYRFFQGAPEDLIHPGLLRGGEPVRTVHLSKKETEGFRLPLLAVCFHAVSRGRRLDLDGRLDTVILHLAKRRVILTWRCKYPVGMNEAADRIRVTTRSQD